MLQDAGASGDQPVLSEHLHDLFPLFVRRVVGNDVEMLPALPEPLHLSEDLLLRSGQKLFADDHAVIFPLGLHELRDARGPDGI